MQGGTRNTCQAVSSGQRCMMFILPRAALCLMLAHAQELEHNAAMPKVELPQELSHELRHEGMAADPAGRDLEDEEEEEEGAKPASTATAWAEHEKDYGAKLPPSVVEFEEDELVGAAKEHEQPLPVERSDSRS